MVDKLISPSILNVEPEKRLVVINQMLDMGIKWIHYDVMDGEFVPNRAINIEEIITFQKECKKHLSDVHLMVNNPWEYARELADHVTCLTVHYEAFANEEDLVKFVDHFAHTNWIGLALKPETTFEQIKNIIYLFDIILVMSVEPGFGGQKFIESSYEKIAIIKKFIDEEKLPTIIQVDGGINDQNSQKLFKMGSSLNVIGSFLINNLNREILKKISK